MRGCEASYFGHSWYVFLANKDHCIYLSLLGVQNKLGWAFGLGLERIAMILFSIPDIRLFWSTDSRFLSQFQEGKVSTFRPYSKYPSCFKDISFWMPMHASLHENDFCDLVRDAAGDLVEDVKKVALVSPLSSKTSEFCLD